MVVDVPAVNYVCEPTVICAVVAETTRSGWPHQSTAVERDETTAAVAYRYLRKNTGTVMCRFGATMGRATCGVVWRKKGKVTARFRVDVRVFEDGSYVTWGLPVRAKVRNG